jgi:CheY-like chemotaxis protein
VPLLKVTCTPDLAATLRQTLEGLGARVHLSAGGSVAFAAFESEPDLAAVDAKLKRLKLSGLTLRGDAQLWLGMRHDFKITAAVKAAIDAENRFPTLDD